MSIAMLICIIHTVTCIYVGSLASYPVLIQLIASRSCIVDVCTDMLYIHTHTNISLYVYICVSFTRQVYIYIYMYIFICYSFIIEPTGINTYAQPHGVNGFYNACVPYR